MQQTRLDQWLKDKLLYETHIFTMRLPEVDFRKGVSVMDVSSQGKGAYKYELIVRSSKRAEEVIELLKANQLMYATHVVEGKRWYRNFIAPEGVSFTYRWILRGLGLICLLSFCAGVYVLFKNEELKKTLR